MKPLKIFIFVLSFSLALPFSSGYSAETLSYDPYVEKYEKPLKQDPLWLRVLQHFPVYPFDLVRYPVEKALILVQKHRLDKKSFWIYNQIKNQGITPKIDIINWFKGGFGAEIDFVRVLRQKHVFPDLIVRGWVKRSEHVEFKTGGEIGLERIGGSGLSVSTLFNYSQRDMEHFYGIGPETSAGEGYVYGLETTTIRPEVRYSLSPFADTSIHFQYQNVNTDGGKDGGRGQIGEGIFDASRTPGIDGDSLIQVGWDISHDTRNHKENSTRGGFRKFSLSFNEGISGSDARYMTYQTEFAQYFSLGNKRRVLALHMYGEHNDELGDGTVPFHQMPKLGGYGASPRLGHPLRGFDYNRFTDESAILINAEYRYTIWEYRHFKVDSVLFFDLGQVFGEFSDFELDNLRESYGVGWRLSGANIPLLSLEAAHGDEGTHFYVKSKTPF